MGRGRVAGIDDQLSELGDEGRVVGVVVGGDQDAVSLGQVGAVSGVLVGKEGVQNGCGNPSVLPAQNPTARLVATAHET